MPPKSINKTDLSDRAVVRELGDDLKQARLNKNWSQSRLAQVTGLDRATISRLENGRPATLLTLVQVLRAIDKLYLLNGFKEEHRASPLQLLKMQERQRQKASPEKVNRKKRSNRHD